jgi:hypothetical protein
MGLQNITDDGMLYWHCKSPNCQYHNCRDLLHEQTNTPIQCVHHDHLEQTDKPKGEAQSVHISHEDVRWMPSGTMVALPICQAEGCTEQLFCKAAFSEEELRAPNITIPEYEESQEQVIDKDREELRAAFKTLGHELPQKVHIVKTRRVIGYHQHPMVSRHLKLAELMKANGKLPPS